MLLCIMTMKIKLKEVFLMRKAIRTSCFYFIYAMAAGVFYREFTKFSGFSGQTTLSVVHTHLLALGMLLWLMLGLTHLPLNRQKLFKPFFVVYNAGLMLTSVMMIVRGTLRVLATPLSRGVTAMISGFAGIGHIALAIGLALLFVLLGKAVKEQA